MKKAREIWVGGALRFRGYSLTSPVELTAKFLTVEEEESKKTFPSRARTVRRSLQEVVEVMSSWTLSV